VVAHEERGKVKGLFCGKKMSTRKTTWGASGDEPGKSNAPPRLGERRWGDERKKRGEGKKSV